MTTTHLITVSPTEPGCLPTISAALAAVLSNRLTARVRLPAPVLFLGGAAAAAALLPGLGAPPERLVERIVTVALLAPALLVTV